MRQSERRALAHELHDTVIQPLAALVTSFECARYQSFTPEVIEANIMAWKELAREAINSLRDTLAGLSVQPNGELGLPEALRRYLAPHMHSHGLPVALDITNWPDDVPLDVTTGLYLAVREALTNVAKHAHASAATVRLRATARHLIVTVADNGVGFRSEDHSRVISALGNRLGIAGMRERVRLLEGRLALTTAPGQGVRIEMRVPRRRHPATATDAR